MRVPSPAGQPRSSARCRARALWCRWSRPPQLHRFIRPPGQVCDTKRPRSGTSPQDPAGLAPLGSPGRVSCRPGPARWASQPCAVQRTRCSQPRGCQQALDWPTLRPLRHRLAGTHKAVGARGSDTAPATGPGCRAARAVVSTRPAPAPRTAHLRPTDRIHPPLASSLRPNHGHRSPARSHSGGRPAASGGCVRRAVEGPALVAPLNDGLHLAAGRSGGGALGDGGGAGRLAPQVKPGVLCMSSASAVVVGVA